MTVVAALKRNGAVWMGCDAMVTDTRYSAKTMTELATPKIFEIGDALIGLAGEHIVLTTIRCYNPPAPKADEATEVWVQKRLLPWLEKTLEKLKPRKDNFAMLVGRGGELFWVEEDNNDVVPVDAYAIGTGTTYAMGAMTAMVDLSMPSEQMVLRAVRAACAHDPYCGGKVTVFTTAEPEDRSK